jgi:hypothetical protein
MDIDAVFSAILAFVAQGLKVGAGGAEEQPAEKQP